MLIVPAIDLLGGKCVRLTRGDYASAVVYGEDPVATAKSMEQAGARWIHIVDLDAARGSGTNRAVLKAIRRAVGCRIEVGGGVRSAADVRELREAGVDRLIVGTVLARSPETVREMARGAPGLLTAGIDAEEGRVKVSGWLEGSGLADTDLTRTAAEIGLSGVVYTSIRRDGTLAGPDLERTNTVAGLGLPVILSGGVGAPVHVDQVAAGRVAGVVGVIVGKALYEGRVDLADLVRRHQTEADVSAW